MTNTPQALSAQALAEETQAGAHSALLAIVLGTAVVMLTASFSLLAAAVYIH